MLVKLTQWAPDVDETTEGLLTDVNNMVPSLSGYKGAPAPTTSGISALNAECRGAAIVVPLDGSNVLFAGTQTELFMATSSSWTDVTRIASDYTGSSTSRWRFAQQGNVTFAVNKVDTSQTYVHGTSSDFIDLAAMPKCAVVEAVGQFILIGNYNAGTDTVDGWACSKIGDYTNWTASVDNQCVYGRLLETPGEITALRRLGDYAIYYKRKAVYIARYVGAPTIWEFSLVSDIVGAVSQEAVVKIGQIHYFLGDEDFYSFDSSSIQPIGGNMREWFNANCNNQYRHKTTSVHDRINGVIYWYFCQGTSSTLNAWVAYHYRTNRWGKGAKDIEAATEFVLGGRTYDDLLALYPTFDDYAGLTFDALSASPQTPLPAIIDTTHTVKVLNGATASCDFTTGDYGMDSDIVRVRRIRPRYLHSPSTATLTNYFKDNEGGSLTTGVLTAETEGKFDLLKAARWHRAKIEFTGDVEITAMDIDAQKAGKR